MWKNLGCGIFVLALLAGCSTADTTGSSKEIDTRTNITITGNEYVYFSVPLSTTSSYEGSQTTDNDPSTSVDPNVSVGLNGSTSSLAAEGGKLLLEGVESIFEAKMNADGGSLVPVIAPEVPTTPTKPTVPTNPIKAETFSMEWRAQHNRSFVWLPQTGSYYGGAVKLTFDNGCAGLTVPDATVNQRSGNAPTWFCGTDNKPEESNGNKASVFSQAGCQATKVTVTYGK